VYPFHEVISAGPLIGPIIVAVSAAGGVTITATTATFIGNLIFTGALAIYAYSQRPDVPKPSDGTVSGKQPIPPREYAVGRGRKAGPKLFEEVTSGGLAISIIALTDGEMDGIEQYLLHEDYVTLDENNFVNGGKEGRYTDFRVNIESRAGLPTETAYQSVIDAFPDLWTEDHRGDGIATLKMAAKSPSAKRYQRAYPNGYPEPSVIGRFAKCWDPRDDEQDPDDPETWKWTANAFVHVLYYVCFHPHGYRRDWRVAYLKTADMWKEAMNVCDEVVPLAAGGTVPRYACGGYWTSETARDSVLKQMLQTCDGWLAEAGDGSWVPFAGKIYEPDEAFELTPSNIIGMSLQNGVAAEDRTKVLVVSFTSPDHKYTDVECDPWGEQELQNAGEVVERSKLEAKWCQHFTQARRLAKRENARLKAEVRGTATTDLFGLNALRNRYVRIKWPVFSTTADIMVEVRKVTVDLKTASVMIDWIKIDPALDDWDPATEEGQRPPIPAETEGDDLPIPPLPTLVLLSDGTVQSSSPPVEGWDGLQLKGRYRKVGDPDWLDAIAPDEEELQVISGVLTDGTWEFQNAYTMGGDEGDWSASETIAIVTDPNAPDVPEDIIATGTPNVSFSARAGDSANTRSMVFKRGTTAQTFAAATTILTANCGPNQVISGVDTPGAGTWRYWAETYNGSGIASGSPIHVDATV
jgi:hypothetical protein